MLDVGDLDARHTPGCRSTRHALPTAEVMSGCLACGCEDLSPCVDFGSLYLPDFVDPGESRGEKWPLRLVMCDRCLLTQLADLVPRGAVIHERYGFFSGLNEQNQRDLKEIADYALFFAGEPKSWLDIGCNDGTLLGAVPAQVEKWGCDPLLAFGAFAEGAERNGVENVDAGFFDPNAYGHGQFDVVTSTAMFYALPDPGTFTEGVRQVLARDGAWVIQQNYAVDMLANNTIDNVLHEHVAYYTVRSLSDLLNRHGLAINHVDYSDVKGGCFRVLVSHLGARPVSRSVDDALLREARSGVHLPQKWTVWAERCQAQLAKTQSFIEGWSSDGRVTYCYGAGNRGGTLVQLLDLVPGVMPFAVERSQAKVGKVWASTGMPIISEQEFRADNPDHLLVSPWFFRDGVIEREDQYLQWGGQMIFPLPHFEVVKA